MLKPICVPCQRFFKADKTGFYFLEGYPADGPAAPGTAEAEKWKPYKLWVGDRWKCEGCGAVIISGTGSRPIVEHYQEEFDKRVKQFGPEFQVNDC